MVSIDFSTQISINSLASGGLGPRTRYKCIFPNFLNFYPHFPQKFDKIFKKLLKKSRNFLEIFLKIVIFHLFFYKFFENFSGFRGAPPPEPPTRRSPLQALSWWTSLLPPPPKKIPAGANGNVFIMFQNHGECQEIVGTPWPS